MHPNEQLLAKYFECLNDHDSKGMANCYHEEATFHDIAFNLNGKKQIYAMWDMICSDNSAGVHSDIQVSVQKLSANDSTGKATTLQDYTYRDNGHNVHNKINSIFEFKEGLIIKQKDDCDPVCWANQAFGGIFGFVAGHFEFIRRLSAMNKLRKARPQAFLEL